MFCEKPLAMTAEEGRGWSRPPRGRPTLVWFNYRRVPAIAYARQLIEEGRIGQVFHYNAAYSSSGGRIRHAPRHGGWIPRRPAPASPTT